MVVSDRVRLTHKAPLELAPKVILGTIDVAAVGARVLLSLEPPPGWTIREIPLELSVGLPPPTATTTATTVGVNQKSEQAEGKFEVKEEEGNSVLRPVLAVPRTTAAAPVATAAAEGPVSLSSPASSSSPSLPSSSPSRPAVLALLRNFYATSTPPPRPAAAAGAPQEAAGGGGGDGSGGSPPAVSLLVLNTAVPEEWQGEVAAAVLELLSGVVQHQEEEEETYWAGDGAAAAAAAAAGADGIMERGITVVAAMLLQQQHPKADALYQHLINDAPPLDQTLPPLLQPPSPILSSSASSAAVEGSVRPAATAAAASHLRVRDGLLAALLHVFGVSGTAACCLLTQGHKPAVSTTLDLPDSMPACDAIGATLAAAFGLQYDPQKCRTVRALYKWFVPEISAGSDVMYL